MNPPTTILRKGTYNAFPQLLGCIYQKDIAIADCKVFSRSFVQFDTITWLRKV